MGVLTEEQAKAHIIKLLTVMVQAGGSDLFISKDFPPSMKAQGTMKPLTSQKLTGEVTRELAQALMNQRQREEYVEPGLVLGLVGAHVADRIDRIDDPQDRRNDGEEHAERLDGKPIDRKEHRYRNALYHLLASQTSCYRYWGQGRFTEMAREICRRGLDILRYDF